MKKILTRLLLMAMILPFTTNAQTPSTFPITCGFENDAENALWTIQNGNSTNKFFIGTAVNNGGAKSLYVSNDANGATNSYDNSVRCFSFAYREFTLAAAGGLIFEYDWKSQGEGSYDFLRVFLMPSNQNLSAFGGPNSQSQVFSNSLPSGCIALDGGNRLSMSNTWQHVETAEINLQAGSYKLVCYWYNDNASGSNPPAAIDNVVIRQESCPTPATLQVTNVTHNSASIAWAEMGTASQWIVEYGVDGFAQGSGTTILLSSNTCVLNNLIDASDYDVYVRALCGVGDTSATLAGSFSTRCLPISHDVLPYAEDFESYVASSSIGSSIDYCWNRFSSSTSTHDIYPYVSENYSYSGSNSIYMYGTESIHSVLVLPQFADTIPSLHLSFKMYRYSTTFMCPIMIGVMSDPDDLETFDTLVTIVSTHSNAWENFEIPLSSYTGSGKYIVICTVEGEFCENYIDDITVSSIADMNCQVPGNLVVGNVTTTGATVSWEDEYGSMWEVEYGPAGFTPGSGISQIVYNQSYTITNLIPSTGYDFYVRNLCGSDNSEYSLRASFRTLCSNYMPVPFVETFDSYGYGTSIKPQCWEYEGYSVGENYPYIYGEYSYSGIASIYMKSSQEPADSIQQWTYIMTPMIDVEMTPINILQTNFRFLSRSNSAQASVIVGVVSDTSNIRGSFYPIDTVTTTTLGEWHEAEIFFSSYPATGTGKYIVFVSTPMVGIGSTGHNSVCIDDIVIKELSMCSRPASISVASVSTSSVTLQWFDEDTTHTEWEVAYGPTGFDINNVHYISSVTINSNITATTTTINNLPQAELYDFYVRTYCSGETSDWRGPVTAAAGTYDMPTNGTDTLTVCGVTIYDDGGVENDYSLLSNSTLVIYPSSPDSVISISGRLDCEENYDKLYIYEGADISGLLLGVFTGNVDIPIIVSSTGPLTINFQSDSYGCESGFELNATCIKPSPCSPVTDVYVDGLAGQSAMIRWDYRRGIQDVPTSYELEVQEVGSASTPVTYSSNNPYYMVAGLSPQTQYVVRVSSVCDEEANLFYDSVVFITPCLVGGDMQIGNGVASSEELPINSYYNYSYSQQIFDAVEIGAASSIAGISLELLEEATDNERNITIYLGHTSISEYNTLNDYVGLSALTQVYSGEYEFSEGWNEIEFATPFQYNGTDNLVVVIDDNTGSYSCCLTFATHEVSADKAMYLFQDGGDILPSSPNASNGGIANERNNIRFIVSCDSTPTCVAPNLAVVDVSHNQIDVIWARGLNETNWMVEYKLATDSIWMVATSSVSDTFYSFTNLNSAAVYDLRVSSICGSETKASVKTVATLCGLYAVPFAENFDGWQTGNAEPFEICWTRLTNDANGERYPAVRTNYAYSAPNAMYMNSDDEFYSAMVLPQFSVPIDSLEISFVLRKADNSNPHQIQVGVVSDPNDISTFVALDIVSPSAVGTWELFEIPLNAYTGNGGHIAIVSPEGITSAPYLDDISVDYIRTCPRVLDLHDSALTSTSVVLNWTDQAAATTWEIEYGTMGFEHGTGTLLTVNSHPCVIANLIPATEYDFYVRAVCSVDDVSRWQKLYVRTLSCDQPNIVTIGNVTDASGNLPISTYYSNYYSQQIFTASEINAVSTGGQLEITSVAFQYFYPDPTLRQNVSIYLGHTSQSNFASTSSWIPEADMQLVYSGDINWNSEQDWFEISFDQSFTYNGTDHLVLAMLDLTGGYTNSSTKFYTHSTPEHRTLRKGLDSNPIDITNPPAGSLEANRNNVRFISCAIVCPKPVELAVEAYPTTAVFSWADVADNYEVSYKESASPVWNTDIMVSNATTYTFENLVPETRYDFRVRSVCDSARISNWVVTSAMTLEMPCLAPIQFVANEIGFTSATISWTDSLNNHAKWIVAYGYGNDAGAWDTVELNNPYVELAGLYSNTEYTVYAKGYCDIENNIYSQWSEAYTFRTAACQPVTNVASADITSNSAVISWTAHDNQTKWEIFYGTEGVNESNGTKVTVDATPVYTLGDLESDMTYDVYVRTICDDGVYSAWSEKHQFRTKMVGISTASYNDVDVAIYPNPANNETTISIADIVGEVEFILTDINGRTIISETIKCEGLLNKTIYVSNWTKGAYFVHIYNTDVKSTAKLIVK